MLLPWYDYLIFLLMLSVSSLIGIYFGCFGSKQKTVNEYLLGSKKMSALSIAFSVTVGHFTAITLMALPADVYKYGAYHWFSCISMVLMVVLSVFVYYPVLFKLRITSVYEYLEKRFDQKTKLFVSSLYIFSEIIFLAVIAYTPSLAFSAATGIRVHLLSSAVCAIGVFYTTVGGLKTVVWTDIFQFAIIIVSLTTVCVIGTKAEGGVSQIWKKAVEGKRLDILDFDLDPTKRDSFWIFVVGFTVHYSNYVVLTQSGIQKFMCLPTFSECVWSLIYVAICMNVITTFVVFIGLLLYSHYENCDPLQSKKVKRHEQLVPYYILEIAGDIPGVSGCFLVAMFSAALSTISSSLNALSGVVYKDFVAKFLKENISDAKVTIILKVNVAFIGCICIGLVLLVPYLGDIAPLGASVVAISQGPSLGIFTLGLLFPKANAIGAFYGGIAGFIFTAVLAIPMKLYQMQGAFKYPSKPISVEYCDGYNVTVTPLSKSLNLTGTSPFTNVQPPFIFRISHYYQTLFGAVLTMIVGLLISYMTNKNDAPVEKSLISPVSRFWMSESPKDKHELHRLVKSRK